MKANWFYGLLVLASIGISGCDLSPGKIHVRLDNTGSHSACYVDAYAHKHLDLGGFSQFVSPSVEDLGTVSPWSIKSVEVEPGSTVTFDCQRCGEIDGAWDVFSSTTINIP